MNLRTHYLAIIKPRNNVLGQPSLNLCLIRVDPNELYLYRRLVHSSGPYAAILKCVPYDSLIKVYFDLTSR